MSRKKKRKKNCTQSCRNKPSWRSFLRALLPVWHEIFLTDQNSYMKTPSTGRRVTPAFQRAYPLIKALSMNVVSWSRSRMSQGIHWATVHSDRTNPVRSLLRFDYQDEHGLRNNSLYCVQFKKICSTNTGWKDTLSRSRQKQGFTEYAASFNGWIYYHCFITACQDSVWYSGGINPSHFWTRD